MYRNRWKKEIFTVPNLLSLFRLGLIPVYVQIYLQADRQEDYFLAGGILALSCATDLLDGIIARSFHMVSQVGKVLDPLADKLTQLALFLCLSSRYPLLYPILGLFLVKELFQLLVCIHHFRRGQALDGALPEGKVCTAVLFTTLIALVLFPQMDPAAAKGLLVTDGAFLLLSFGSYVGAYYGRDRKLHDL